jgi:glycosyltransferase involved in cell wall biosynthesis
MVSLGHDRVALESISAKCRMKILTVAYPFASVAPDSVGGAEQIAFQIAEALRRRGHDSQLLAREDSKFDGPLLLVPHTNGPLNDHAVRDPVYRVLRNRLAQTDADLIHFHSIDFHEYIPSSITRPTLVTLHLPLDWYPRDALLPRENLHFNCVSNPQLACSPTDVDASVIPNGVAIPSFKVLPKKRNFVLSMGRICPEKGFHLALDAAAEAKVPFLLAGEVFPYESHQRYFREEIVPRLSNERRFIGRIGGARKWRLLAAAKCLVAASLVNETSSLVTMEAMSCGTPVIAFRRGALASLVQDCHTGFLVDKEAELTAAIRSADLIDPQACRDFAHQHFSLDAMIRRYLHLYQGFYLKGQTRSREPAEAVLPAKLCRPC